MRIDIKLTPKDNNKTGILVEAYLGNMSLAASRGLEAAVQALLPSPVEVSKTEYLRICGVEKLPMETVASFLTQEALENCGIEFVKGDSYDAYEKDGRIEISIMLCRKNFVELLMRVLSGPQYLNSINNTEVA